MDIRLGQCAHDSNDANAAKNLDICSESEGEDSTAAQEERISGLSRTDCLPG